VRRERKLESTLAKLRKLCIELGVEDAEVAASVHPSLRNYHQSMRGHYFSFTAAKPATETSEQQPQVRLHTLRRPLHACVQPGPLLHAHAQLDPIAPCLSSCCVARLQKGVS
jgi:hypothetical protein